MGVDEKQVRDVRKLGALPTGMVEYSTATLSDGLQKVGVTDRVLDHSIRPVVPFTRMAGIAVTVKLAPADKPTNHSALLAQAFEAGRDVASPVLVIEQPPEVPVVGSGGAHCLRHHFGFVGCLTEGCVRDTEDLRRMNFPAFSRSIRAEFVFGLLKGVSVNEPVRVGDVEICAGDYVVGDHDGVVAVPAARLDEVLAACRDVLEQERRILEEIDEGTPYVEVLRRLQPEAFPDEG